MNKPRFCSPMRKHFMTTAASNAAAALCMAKELQSIIGHQAGIQPIVHIINVASLELIKLCESYAFNEQPAQADGERQ